MVLNDGETFTELNDCFVAEFPKDYSTEQVEEALRNGEDIFKIYFEEHHGVIHMDIQKTVPLNINIE